MITLRKAQPDYSITTNYYYLNEEYYIGQENTIYRAYHYFGNDYIHTKTKDKKNITKCEFLYLGLFEFMLIKRC